MRMIKTTLAVFAATGMLALVGCSNTRSDMADADEPVVAPSTSAPVMTDSTPATRRVPNTGTPAIETQRVDGTALTGVEVCDEYLSSYKRCHAVAGVYRDDVIDSRFAETRDALVRQSRDPVLSQDLSQRCSALKSDLDEVLDGRDCLPETSGDLATATDTDNDGVIDEVSRQ